MTRSPAWKRRRAEAQKQKALNQQTTGQSNNNTNARSPNNESTATCDEEEIDRSRAGWQVKKYHGGKIRQPKLTDKIPGFDPVEYVDAVIDNLLRTELRTTSIGYGNYETAVVPKSNRGCKDIRVKHPAETLSTGFQLLDFTDEILAKIVNYSVVSDAVIQVDTMFKPIWKSRIELWRFRPTTPWEPLLTCKRFAELGTEVYFHENTFSVDIKAMADRQNVKEYYEAWPLDYPSTRLPLEYIQFLIITNYGGLSWQVSMKLLTAFKNQLKSITFNTQFETPMEWSQLNQGLPQPQMTRLDGPDKNNKVLKTFHDFETFSGSLSDEFKDAMNAIDGQTNVGLGELGDNMRESLELAEISTKGLHIAVGGKTPYWTLNACLKTSYGLVADLRIGAETLARGERLGPAPPKVNRFRIIGPCEPHVVRLTKEEQRAQKIEQARLDKEGREWCAAQLEKSHAEAAERMPWLKTRLNQKSSK